MRKLVLVLVCVLCLAGAACGTADYAEVVKDTEEKQARDGCVTVELTEVGVNTETHDLVGICGEGAERVEDFFRRRTSPASPVTTERPRKSDAP